MNDVIDAFDASRVAARAHAKLAAADELTSVFDTLALTKYRLLERDPARPKEPGRTQSLRSTYSFVPDQENHL